jgi:hypothetical protein
MDEPCPVSGEEPPLVRDKGRKWRGGDDPTPTSTSSDHAQPMSAATSLGFAGPCGRARLAGRAERRMTSKTI